MQLDDLNLLAAFLAVAEERSFTRAAKRVGVSRSALSHAVRGLEERIGVRLLSRTTRSVAPTDAGEQLLGRLRPALADVASVLDHIAERRARPAGPVRLVVSPLAAAMVLAPKSSAHLRTRTPMSFSTSRRRTKCASIWSPGTSTPAFTLVSSSSAT
jgi:DNA-binding transcriptional LysR family regulator